MQPRSLAELVELFQPQVELDRSTGCVLLVRSARGDLYRPGRRVRVTVAGIRYRVYRLALELSLGRQLRDDEVVRHTCDEPACINWWHLLPGTQADNLADMRARGRAHYPWQPGVLQPTVMNQVGASHREDTKARIADSLRGRKDSDEVRERKRAAARLREQKKREKVSE